MDLNDQVDIFATDPTPQSQDQTGGDGKANDPQVPETFEWSGRQLTAKELHEEAKKLQQDYTVKTGKLSEYEKSVPQPTVDPVTGEADPIMEELRQRKVITQDELETVKSQWIQEAADKVRREQTFEETLRSAESKYSGDNGKPKFERAKVLNEMNNSNDPLYGKVFDPILWFELKNNDQINQFKLQELQDARNSNPTDLTGSPTGGQANKPASSDKSFGQMNAEEMIEQFKNVNLTF
jgi:hypothetical protein